MSASLSDKLQTVVGAAITDATEHRLPVSEGLVRPFRQCVVAPLICDICGEEMILPAGGQSHALCECDELRQVENRKARAA